MKIPINLASQPFRRDRAMIAASVALSLLLLITLGGLISLALADRAQSADVRREVDRLQKAIRRVNAEKAQVDAELRKPQNAEVLERSVFLNQVLLRKGISWTRIFSDLEKYLPYNAKIVQIRPSVDLDDRVTLEMVVAAESPAPVIEFLAALKKSPVFGPVGWQNYIGPTTAEPLYRYRVNVTYAQKL